MSEPLDSFRTAFTLTQLVRSRHIHDIFDGAKRMTESDAVAEASQDDVVLVLRISEAQGDGLLVSHRGAELPQLIYFTKDNAD